MVLLHSTQPLLSRLQELVIEQLCFLSQPAQRTEDRFVTSLHRIQLNYSRLTERYLAL